MRTLTSVTKALADENRLRILNALRHGELCVCQLIELLGLAPSTVSKHLSILRQAGLVESRKEGRWMHYRLPDNAALVVRGALAWVLSALAGTDTAQRDEVQLSEILKEGKEALCQRMSR
ncbi:winged helix-turn-helix transcriptional regulator [Candidatus Fermentibacteria bacterium]|nr:winged helix-turn-helix transcriptional regulator [Candidatus Fermentibacteria bacterium]